MNKIFINHLIGCKIKHIKSYFNEGILLCRYNHERILTPIGVCIEGDYPMIILLIMSNGDLLSYLSNNDNILTVKQLMHFAVQISEGILDKYNINL